MLPQFPGDIPELTLAIMAYTVNTYALASGPRKDQLTACLNIHFGVVLHEPMGSEEASGNEEQDD